MFMSKMSPFQFRKLPFMQNLLTLCFPILKNGLFKHVASAGAIKENQSTGISVSWVGFCIFISKQVDELGVASFRPGRCPTVDPILLPEG